MINETNKRMDAVRDELIRLIMDIHKRLDRLYEVIVRREEHTDLERRVAQLEEAVRELKARFAA